MSNRVEYNLLALNYDQWFEEEHLSGAVQAEEENKTKIFKSEILIMMLLGWKL
jgi:hypothetical protein